MPAFHVKMPADDPQDPGDKGKTEKPSSDDATAKEERPKKGKGKAPVSDDAESKDAPSSSVNPLSTLLSKIDAQGDGAEGKDKEKAAEKLKKVDVASLLKNLVRHPDSRPLEEELTSCAGIEREEPKGHGLVQVLADPTGTPLRSVPVLQSPR